MGIDSWVFKATKRTYKGTMVSAFPDLLKHRRHVAVEDLQKVIKAKPDFVTTIHGFLKYVIDFIVSRMRRKDIPSPHFTALFDRWTPPAKSAIAHVKRDKGALVTLKRKPSDYLRGNMMVTTSGNYLPAAFKCTREALGMDKIMLGTDHPYEDMGECLGFLEGLGLSAEEKEMLYSGNAEHLGIV